MQVLSQNPFPPLDDWFVVLMFQWCDPPFRVVIVVLVVVIWVVSIVIVIVNVVIVIVGCMILVMVMVAMIVPIKCFAIVCYEVCYCCG